MPNYSIDKVGWGANLRVRWYKISAKEGAVEERIVVVATGRAHAIRTAGGRIK